MELAGTGMAQLHRSVQQQQPLTTACTAKLICHTSDCVTADCNTFDTLCLMSVMSMVLVPLQVDLDLGNYERFLDITLTRDNNLTTGKVYQVNLVHVPQ